MGYGGWVRVGDITARSTHTVASSYSYSQKYSRTIRLRLNNAWGRIATAMLVFAKTAKHSRSVKTQQGKAIAILTTPPTTPIFHSFCQQARSIFKLCGLQYLLARLTIVDFCNRRRNTLGDNSAFRTRYSSGELNLVAIIHCYSQFR